MAAAAPLYDMVLDEWLESARDITVPVYWFFAGIDSFIPSDRIRKMESGLKELGKDYQLKVY